MHERRTWLGWLLGAGIALSAPAHAQMDPQIPAGYGGRASSSTVHYADHTTSIRALWMSGLVLLPASYLATFVLAALSQTPDYWPYSAIPIVGPWMMATLARDGSEMAGAIVGGIAQGAAALLLVLGIAVRQTIRVAIYGAQGSAELAVVAAPLIGGAELGLELTHS